MNIASCSTIRCWMKLFSNAQHNSQKVPNMPRISDEILLVNNDQFNFTNFKSFIHLHLDNLEICIRNNVLLGHTREELNIICDFAALNETEVHGSGHLWVLLVVWPVLGALFLFSSVLGGSSRLLCAGRHFPVVVFFVCGYRSGCRHWRCGHVVFAFVCLAVVVVCGWPALFVMVGVTCEGRGCRAH